MKTELIKSVMENYPEASATNTLRCTKFDYKKMQFDFWDANTDEMHFVNLKMLRKGLEILIKAVENGRYFNSGKPPALLSKGYDWDGQDCDALVQCAIFGDVIYG